MSDQQERRTIDLGASVDIIAQLTLARTISK